MRSFFGLLVILSMGFVISSCSTISKEECTVGDWSGMGQRDASQGHKQDRFYTYVKECGEHGVRPDHNAYKSGYSEGLKTYCTAENGWRVGRNGGVNNGICPKEAARAFNRAYTKGREVYNLNQKIASVDQEIRDLDTKIDESQKQMFVGKKSGTEVAVIALEMGKLQKRQRQLEREKDQLQQKLQSLDAQASVID